MKEYQQELLYLYLVGEKAQQLDSKKEKLKIKIKYHSIIGIPIIFMMGMLFSCENDLKTISAITTTDDSPSEVVNDMHTLYSDSGIVVYEIIASRMEKYEEPKNLTIFKNGFEVNFFKGKDSIVSKLTADYAEIRDQGNLIIARNNVIFTNYEKMQTLKTEELFWDKNIKRVRTEKQFIITGVGTKVMGYGLDTDESFTEYNAHKVSIDKRDTLGQ